MAIGRISGSVLKSNLTRNGVDLAFETNLLYLDVTNSRVGIGTSEPSTALDIAGTVTATTFAGSTATLTNTTTGDSLLITTTEDSSTAAPVITLKRNSSSPADADYLGQIKFKGENDADQEQVYAKITGKIQDASDGSEDGLIEFANRKAGSNVITARLRSDSLQLLNDTNLSVAGTSTLTGDVTIGGMSGSANEIVIVGDANGLLTSTDLLALDTVNTRIGVGTTSPITKFHIAGEGSNEGQIMIQQAFDGADGPDLRFRSSRGTIASPSAVQNGDTHARVNSFAYNGSSYVQSGTFGWSASDGDGNNYFDIRTSVSGTLANRIEVTTAGAVRISGAYNLPTADGSANQVLRTNGSDTVSFGEPNLDIVNALSAAASVALDPTLGGIQTITLGQATTFTLSNWASGHRMTLMIDDGSNYAVTWPTIQWAGGVAPTLATSGYNTIELWYVGSTLYGAYVGAHS